MKKILSMIFLLVGAITLTSGMGMLVLDEKAEIKQLEALKTSIVNDYENFKVKVEVFSEERSNVYESLNKLTYLTDIKNNYELLVDEYEKYEETLNDLDKVSTNLKVNCFEQEFEETNINNKISAFVINYEQSVNYFIQDVNSFNERVRKYNEWLDTLVNNEQYPRLEEYKSNYTTYVDIDNNGVSEGVN